MAKKDPLAAEKAFEARMRKLAQENKVAAKSNSKPIDPNAAETARRAANVAKSQEQERQSKIRHEAEMARRAENLKKARRGY